MTQDLILFDASKTIEIKAFAMKLWSLNSYPQCENFRIFQPISNNGNYSGTFPAGKGHFARKFPGFVKIGLSLTQGHGSFIDVHT